MHMQQGDIRYSIITRYLSSNFCSKMLRNLHLFHTRNPKYKVLEQIPKAEPGLNGNTSLGLPGKSPIPPKLYG
jgi:hypothetical protein